jgi:RimJ/RimL family protein N-acetyltransferase
LEIWIDKDYRGIDLSQARAESLIYIAFEHLGLDIIEVRVVSKNITSIKSVEKYMREFGGSFDGRLRNETHTPNNGVHNTYQWSISKDEFYNNDAEYTNFNLELD